MTKPIPVHVVRPRPTRDDSLGRLLALIIDYALSAYIVMSFLAFATTWHPSYLTSLFGIVAFRSLSKNSALAVDYWTVEGSKS